MPENNFTFNISLSVLNHLGRNLYRSFTTVLGEAISNSWDADAKNVHIYLNREENTFCIKDDGDGMTDQDFQNKFLRVGYSKRKEGKNSSPGGRPYIGRKGIGKLALLSCAQKISVKSKIEGGEYVGGVIDNRGLDEAIEDDMLPSEYPLGHCDDSLFRPYEKGHAKGTIIFFENIKDGISNTDNFLKKIIALYFRFSLRDKNFQIYLNDELVTLESLRPLAEKTQFIWNINNFKDPYLENLCTKAKKITPKKMSREFEGFIASVDKPRDRNIHSAGERVAVDLFVNGRLREVDTLKHLPSLRARVPETYLYGQIHFDNLDSGEDDPFTSSREGIRSENKEYQKFLEELEKVLLGIMEEWDTLRRKHRKEGDSDNQSITPKQRRAEALANVVFEDYLPDKDSKQRGKIKSWIKDIRADASFNFESYADCFASENLLRKYIHEKNIPLSSKAQKVADKHKEAEKKNKQEGNVSIDIRRDDHDLSYLSMEDLMRLIDEKNLSVELPLKNDLSGYKPIRDAAAHTACLTDKAKNKLKSVYENIEAKVKDLLTTDVSNPPTDS